MKAFGRSLWNDVRDQGALPQSQTIADVVGLVSLAGLSLGGITGLLANLQFILRFIPSIPSSSIPLVCGLFGSLWSFGLVTLKTEVSEIDPSLGEPHTVTIKRYRYGQPPRQIAKLLLLPLVLVLCAAGVRTYREIAPIPRIIYGFVRDQHGPLAGVTVRVYTSSNTDLTDASWSSGSDGFYITEARGRVPRSAHLVADWPGCAEVQPQLLLRSADELPQDSTPPRANGLSPIFRHTLVCERPQ
jgi:hypothetical protein